MLSLLSYLFTVERHRQRAGDVGYARPLLAEIEVNDLHVQPLLATNADGEFVHTHVSRYGHMRFGFTELAPAHEDKLILNLYSYVVDHHAQLGWDSTASTVEEGLAKMASKGVPPRFVLSTEAPSQLPEGVQHLKVDLGLEKALLMSSPTNNGLYTRVGDFVGVMVQQASFTVLAIV